MVFEDVVFDNNRFDICVAITTTHTRVTKLLLANTASSNTTSLNSRSYLVFGRGVAGMQRRAVLGRARGRSVVVVVILIAVVNLIVVVNNSSTK